MKTKIRLTETNLISLIKRILLEQSDIPSDNEIEARYAKPAPSPMGMEDMDTLETLAQSDAYKKQELAQQKLAQQKKNQSRVCPSYKEPTNGVYGLCSGGELVGKLQKVLKITTDNKFGPQTEKVLFNKYNVKKVNKTQINNIISGADINKRVTKPPMLSLRKEYNGIYINNAFHPKNDEKFPNKSKEIHLTSRMGGFRYATSCSKIKLTPNLAYWDGDSYINISDLNDSLLKHFCK